MVIARHIYMVSRHQHNVQTQVMVIARHIYGI